MSDITKVARQERILQLLSHIRSEDYALTISEIYDDLRQSGFTMSKRTVDRDIKALSISTGIASNEQGTPRYFISADYKIQHNVRLNSDSLQTIFIALKQLGESSHNYFKEMATQAQTTIGNALSEDLKKELNKHKQKYYFESGLAKPSSSNPNDFRSILHALRENLIFTCLNKSPYQSQAKQERERMFAPIVFIMSANIPYLIVRDIDDKKIKKLRVTRISNVDVTNDSFERTEEEMSLKLTGMIGGWGGIDEDAQDITITCKSYLATYVDERVIHHSQQVTELKNGNHKITMSCAPSHELVRLLSSFGDEIISVAPQDIYDEVIAIWEGGIDSLDDAA